jgi:hypothetical protein
MKDNKKLASIDLEAALIASENHINTILWPDVLSLLSEIKQEITDAKLAKQNAEIAYAIALTKRE